MSNDSQIIVISGISKGIGRSIALKFAELGFNVAGFARNKSDLSQLEKLLKDKFNKDLLWSAVDISKKDEVKDFAAMVKDRYGKIDVLVNNAGFFIPGSISEEEDGVLEKTMETNMYGTYYLTREFIPLLKSAAKSHIFTICSTASIKAYPNGGSYCISKFAMLGFTKVLREELKEQNIRVTAIMPGPTFTSSWEGADIPEERFMAADDVAEVVLSNYKLPAGTVIEEVVMRPQLGDL